MIRHSRPGVLNRQCFNILDGRAVRRHYAANELSIMKVDVLTISDYAFEAEGKLNILGTFAHIPVKSVPYVHEGVYVTVQLRFSKAEEGAHALNLRLLDMDGREFGKPINHRFNVKFHDDAPVQFVKFIGRFKDLKFNNYGEHILDLAIDGLEAASLPLYIRKPGSGSAASGAVAVPAP